MTNSSPLKLIIFGGSGVLGSAIAEKFKTHDYKVTYGVRTITNPVDQFLLHSFPTRRSSDHRKSVV